MCKTVIKIGILDDDSAVLGLITSAAESTFMANGVIARIKAYTSASEFKRSMAENEFDLVFLDIKMPGADGVELGAALKNAENSPDIIYVSSREDRVFETFPVRPFGFVRKSHFLKDFSATVKAYVTQMNKKSSQISVSVPTHGGRVSVPVSNILYIEGSGVYQQVHLKNKRETIECTSRMEKLESELKESGFMRIHKGYLVNFFYISHIGATELMLENGEKLPISRRNSQRIKSEYLELSRHNGILLN
ncbi:MAG: response regulator transcription factor [Clostridia bacterium]|nr:response regulator transcription factor [Clostridia bacterium]